MSKLTFISSIVAFDDLSINSNPTRTPINWSRTNMNIPVDVPGTMEHWTPSLASTLIFDGTRTTTIDGTTAFTLALSPLDPTRYRITNTGGTAPAFRTVRSVPVTGVVLTVAVLANLSVTVTAGTGTPFSAVQVGDVVFIPGISTGDPAGVFNDLNVGVWTVLAQTSTQLTLSRNPGSVFSGVAEVQTPASNSQFQVFTSAGVQIGDMVDISAGFSLATQRTYEVLAVTASWVEILSTLPLGGQTGVTPTATGMQFYSSSKSFVYIEVDQDCVIQFNGDTGNTNRVTAFIPGDSNNVGFCAKSGPVWKCTIVNRSTSVLHTTELTAE